ncbi:MAG: hypothetical protein MJA30_32895 [Cytophagales bacterium]|nr:hypothetical protein [Cytophagales bacterium]
MRGLNQRLIFFCTLQGVYSDLTPNWYREVGRSLTITVIISSGVRLMRVVAKWLAFKWQFWWRKSSLTQTQMNKAFQGPEFELAPRYGELLNLIFVTMLFGGGGCAQTWMLMDHVEALPIKPWPWMLC